MFVTSSSWAIENGQGESSAKYVRDFAYYTPRHRSGTLNGLQSGQSAEGTRPQLRRCSRRGPPVLEDIAGRTRKNLIPISSSSRTSRGATERLLEDPGRLRAEYGRGISKKTVSPAIYVLTSSRVTSRPHMWITVRSTSTGRVTEDSRRTAM